MFPSSLSLQILLQDSVRRNWGATNGGDIRRGDRPPTVRRSHHRQSGVRSIATPLSPPPSSLCLSLPQDTTPGFNLWPHQNWNETFTRRQLPYLLSGALAISHLRFFPWVKIIHLSLYFFFIIFNECYLARLVLLCIINYDIFFCLPFVYLLFCLFVCCLAQSHQHLPHLIRLFQFLIYIIPTYVLLIWLWITLVKCQRRHKTICNTDVYASKFTTDRMTTYIYTTLQ